MSFTNLWFGFSNVWSEKRLNDEKLRHRLAVFKLNSESQRCETRDERRTFTLCSVDELSASISWLEAALPISLELNQESINW